MLLNKHRTLLLTLLALLLTTTTVTAQIIPEGVGDRELTLVNPLSGDGVTISVLRLAYIVGGLILLVAGWRVHRLALGIGGAIVGATFALSFVPPDSGLFIELIALLIGGVIGGALASFVFYLGVFLLGAYIGLLVTAQIWLVAFGVQPGLIAQIIGALIGGFLLLALSFELVVLVTAAAGAVMLAQAFNLQLIVALVLLVIGVLIQAAIARRSGRSAFRRRRATDTF